MPTWAPKSTLFPLWGHDHFDKAKPRVIGERKATGADLNGIAGLPGETRSGFFVGQKLDLEMGVKGGEGEERSLSAERVP